MVIAILRPDALMFNVRLNSLLYSSRLLPVGQRPQCSETVTPGVLLIR
jgi:hypothetical protein